MNLEFTCLVRKVSYLDKKCRCLSRRKICNAKLENSSAIRIKISAFQHLRCANFLKTVGEFSLDS